MGNLPAAPGATYAKRNLPHFEKPWAIYVVNFQTFGGRTLSPAARDLVFDCNDKIEIFDFDEYVDVILLASKTRSVQGRETDSSRGIRKLLKRNFRTIEDCWFSLPQSEMNRKKMAG